MGNKIEYIEGQQIGSCFFIKEESPHKQKSGQTKRRATFLCTCGKEFIAKISEVKHGSTSSCGCFQKEVLRTIHKTHGLTKSREYVIWLRMKDRCYKVSHPRYKDWGGRGITVCDKWVESFENFYADMGKRPSKKHELDRINNDLGYYKENCRWATKKQQSNNRRSNIVVEYNGETKTLKEWCEHINISYQLVYRRYKLYGWPIEKAFYIPKVRDQRYIREFKRKVA
jgi:hypothetical protein